MFSTKILAVLQAISDWKDGSAHISVVCELLGDGSNEIGQMLMLNGLADFQYKPMEGYSYQTIVDAILLYISMRGQIRKTLGKKP